MRILQLCIRVPYPPVDGGSIAMYNLQKSLHHNGAVLKVLSFNTIKQLADINSLDQDYREMTRIEGIYLDNRIKPFAALFNIFTGESYHIIRFIRRDFEEALVRILKEESFDIIQLESLYMIPYMEAIRKHSKAKVVLRTHNIEHLIWQRLADACRNPVRRWYLNLLSERLRHYEQWSLNRVDAIAAMTPEDDKTLKELGAEVPTCIAPVGVNMDDYIVHSQPDTKVVFHIGAMDWMPNQEGIHWFLNEVWPKVLTKVPDARLRLAGKKMPDYIKAYASSSVEVNDFVEDGKGFIGQGGIMIVPLFSGSGMRVKIVEGMAMGKAILSTSIGAEGIGGKEGQEYLIANDANTFTEKVIYLLTHPEVQHELGRNARKYAENTFGNNAIGARLIAFYEYLQTVED